jgi:hypothetical protein
LEKKKLEGGRVMLEEGWVGSGKEFVLLLVVYGVFSVVLGWIEW